jgi:dTDP-4-dehydrorhamnose 3,5-epimerase-like enzyme
LSKSFDYFIILKDDVPGSNKYEDNNIIRTSDHLIMILYKVQKFYNEIEVSKDNFRKFLIDRPYDSDQPKFQPSLKTKGISQ